ncbi:MAG: undecaprenyl-diphosphate phosphatase [Acidimicrobiales bacterium]
MVLVAQKILGLGGDEATDRALETFAICIQAGAILAVLFLYWGRIRQMLDGLIGRSEEGRHVLIAVITAFIPTAIIGLVIQDPVREYLFGVWPIALSWLVGGIGILVLGRTGFMNRPGKALGEITAQNALVIGVLQAIAMWPGTSRSLVTILAGILIGLSLKAAVEFSFLLGLITLTAATAYEGLQNGPALIDQFGVVNPLIGLVVAFISAMAAVKWMVAWLEQKGFDIFGYYRIAIGLAAFAALGAGAL